MSKVTSKYQVTVPKAIAERYGIRPGDDIEWIAAGDVIRVIPEDKQPDADDRESRLRVFDEATERHHERSAKSRPQQNRGRGWKREGLYGRGRSG